MDVGTEPQRIAQPGHYRPYLTEIVVPEPWAPLLVQSVRHEAGRHLSWAGLGICHSEYPCLLSLVALSKIATKVQVTPVVTLSRNFQVSCSIYAREVL